MVLGIGALLFIMLGLRDIVGPLAVAAGTNTTLGSPDAVTVVRATGGAFLGIAIALVYCLAAEGRLLPGLALLATIITWVAGVRLVGVIVDGPGPFTLKLLTPEIILAALSAGAVMLERRRAQSLASSN